MTFSSMIQGLIYSFLYSIAATLLLPFQYRKRPKEFRRRWLREKLGFFDYEPRAMGSKLIWIHAVSVGEVMAALPLLRRLKESFPSIRLLLSTITDTGQSVAIEKVPKDTQVIYLPFDIGFILKKAIKDAGPGIFITMETELWPNLFRAFKKQGIPVMIMNGRISDNSFRGYSRIKFFMRGIIECVDFFGMQDGIYAQRVEALGAPGEKVKVIGNFKFDTRPSGDIPEWTQALSHPIVIAGSTHRGEEDLIISAYEKLKNDFPDMNLIIAPRHPNRFGEVAELIKAKGLEYVRRSGLLNRAEEQKSRRAEAKDSQPSELPNFQSSGQIVILDAMGELSSVYGACDIAIMGGSFIERGGQNLLEPAYWSKPIICGPHMENFPFVKEFYEKGGAIESYESGLFERLKELLESPEKRNAIGKKARELYIEKSGAAGRAVREIEKFLK